MTDDPRRRVGRGVLLASLLVCAGACDRRDPAGEQGGAALMQNLMRVGRVDVEASEHALEEPLERAALNARRTARPNVGAWLSNARDIDMIVRAKNAARDKSAARIVVGTPASDAVRAIAERVGVKSGVEGGRAAFFFADQEFGDPADALIATFEDPERAGLPLTLVLGNGTAELGRRARDLAPSWKPWVSVFRGSALVLSGPLSTSGPARAGEIRRVGIERMLAESAITPLAKAPSGFVVRASREIAPADVDDYLARCSAAQSRVRAWALLPDAGSAEPGPTRIVLHARIESFALAGGGDTLAVFDPVSRDVAAWVAGTLHDGGACAAESLASARLGEPGEDWMLEAAGVEAAWTWYGRPLDRWLARLVAARRILPTTLLVAARANESASAHLVGPERGALWRFLRETRGDTFVREVWQNTQALEATQELDARFLEWLVARVAPIAHEVAGRGAARHEAALSASFFKGVGLAETPFGVRTGYASQACLESLDAARAIGADAVALTSFCVDDPGVSPLACTTGLRGTYGLGPREGDAKLFIAIQVAHALGLRVLIQPHLLSGPAGTWSGSWTRKDEADWQRFFERYTRFVEHYALLAELTECEALSIGRGLAAVTSEKAEGRRANPAEVQWKHEGWQQVLTAARSSFDGLLTYSAESTEEADKVSFWHDVDAIGFELFPSLATPGSSAQGTPRGRTARDEITESTQRDLDQLASLSARVGKPILITQAGFDPSLIGSASALGRGSASAGWQAEEIGFVGDCLHAARGRAKFMGVFAWRWSSDVNDVGASSHDCVIAHPAARAALRVFFNDI